MGSVFVVSTNNSQNKQYPLTRTHNTSYITWMPSSADAKTPNTTQQYYKSKHQLLSNIFEPFAACASHKHGKRIEKKKNKNNNNNNKF